MSPFTLVTRWIRSSRLRVRALFQRDAVEQELDDEFRYHLDRQVDAHVARGMTPADARYAALRDMGGLEQQKEAIRDTRSVGLVDGLSRDVSHGVRLLRRNPGFALVGVLVMALGIGANTAVFSVVNAVLLKPLPHPEPGRIVTLAYATRASATSEALSRQIAIPDFRDWQAQASTFDAMSFYATRRASVMTGDAAEYATVTRVTPDFFRVFGMTPIAGRLMTTEDALEGSVGTVVVSASYAQQHFGDPARALGRTIRVFNRTPAIVGVLPAGVEYPFETEIYYPVTVLGDPTRAMRGANNYLAAGRIKAGVSLEQAQAEMTSISRRLQQLYPDTNKGHDVVVSRLRDRIVGPVELMLYLLLGAAGLVLLIACANMATLLLARATGRVQEIAIRTALGASRARIVRQLLVEGLIHALVAGAAALLVAVWGTKVLIALAPENLPRIAETTVDTRVLAFTFAVSIIVSLLFGLPPALQAARGDVNEPLRQGASRTVIGGRAGRLREALVVIEIALAVVLLAGGGLLIKSLLALQQTQLGFQPSRVLVMEATFASSNPEARRNPSAFFSALLEDIRPLPGVLAAGAAMAPPGHVESASAYAIDHLPKVLGPDMPGAVLNVIAPSTFSALGVPLRRGRDFLDSDTREAPMVAIINETIARDAFRGQDPIGRTIFCLFDTGKPMTIVGVVGDVRQGGPGLPPRAECYMPYTQHSFNGSTLSLVIRTAVEPGALADTVRRAARARSPEVSVRVTTMEALLDRHMATPRFRAVVVSLFAAIALCLALAGVYGVMSFVVGQRATEIGLRMALGASASSVLWLLLRRGLLLVTLGLTLGLVGAIATTRLLRTLLFEVAPTDLATYALVAALLALTSLLAIYIPARRSLTVDPLVALRQQ